MALARALAVEPRVLLLDEPFGALDARVRKDLRRWLRDIHRRTGQTTIFVTHDQDEALELSDRVAILNGGRLEQVGTPDEIYDQPGSAFVMSFVGDSVRLPVRIEGGVAFLGATALPVSVPGLADGEAALFVRPWEVALGGEAEGSIEGVVGFVRRVPSGRRAEIGFAGTDAILDIDLPHSGSFAPGQPVRLRIAGGRVFPAA